MFLIALMYALLAGTFVVGKMALTLSPPAFLIGVRMLLGGSILLFIYRVVLGRKTSVTRADWGLLLWTSIFHIYLTYVPEFWALQYLTASKTILLFSMTPFVTALLDSILHKQHLTRWQWAGMTLAFASLMPVILFAQAPGELNGNLWSISLPELSLFWTVTSGAYAWFQVKELMKRGYSPILINGIAMILGGAMALLHGWVTEGFYPLAPGTFAPFMGYVMLLILMANIIFYNAYGWLIHKYGITQVALVGFLSPIFGGIMGWLFLGEQLTWHYAVSLAGIGYGLRLFFKK